MENNDNKKNKVETENQNPKDESLCSVFATYDEAGRKKPSILAYAILAVMIIGGIGIISSTKSAQKELINNTNEQTLQLQKEAEMLKTKAAIKNNSLKANKTNEEKEIVMISKIKEMQEAHSKQMQQAMKAFESLKASYSQKLNEVVSNMKAEQEAKEHAKEQEVPNPELNFQLRGLSNIKVQFNKTKDISYIEIIQPDGKKAWDGNKNTNTETSDNSNCYPKKDAACDDKEDKSWGDCGVNKCYPTPMPMTQGEYKNSNNWDCESKYDSETGGVQDSDCY